MLQNIQASQTDTDWDPLWALACILVSSVTEGSSLWNVQASQTDADWDTGYQHAFSFSSFQQAPVSLWEVYMILWMLTSLRLILG